MQTTSVQISLSIPSDHQLLAAVGEMALRHAHLDYTLRMTIKTLTGLRVESALAETFLNGSSKMRKKVDGLARQKLPDERDFASLQAILARCEDASELRNRLLHGVWAQNIDGGRIRIFCEWRHGGKWQTAWVPSPTVKEVSKLSRTLFELTKELNEARRRGFLHAALTKAATKD